MMGFNAQNAPTAVNATSVATGSSSNITTQIQSINGDTISALPSVHLLTGALPPDTMRLFNAERTSYASQEADRGDNFSPSGIGTNPTGGRGK